MTAGRLGLYSWDALRSLRPSHWVRALTGDRSALVSPGSLEWEPHWLGFTCELEGETLVVRAELRQGERGAVVLSRAGEAPGYFRHRLHLGRARARLRDLLQAAGQAPRSPPSWDLLWADAGLATQPAAWAFRCPVCHALHSERRWRDSLRCSHCSSLSEPTLDLHSVPLRDLERAPWGGDRSPAEVPWILSQRLLPGSSSITLRVPTLEGRWSLRAGGDHSAVLITDPQAPLSEIPLEVSEARRLPEHFRLRPGGSAVLQQESSASRLVLLMRPYPFASSLKLLTRLSLTQESLQRLWGEQRALPCRSMTLLKITLQEPDCSRGDSSGSAPELDRWLNAEERQGRLLSAGANSRLLLYSSAEAALPEVSLLLKAAEEGGCPWIYRLAILEEAGSLERLQSLLLPSRVLLERLDKLLLHGADGQLTMERGSAEYWQERGLLPGQLTPHRLPQESHRPLEISRWQPQPPSQAASSSS